MTPISLLLPARVSTCSRSGASEFRLMAVKLSRSRQYGHVLRLLLYDKTTHVLPPHLNNRGHPASAHRAPKQPLTARSIDFLSRQ